MKSFDASAEQEPRPVRIILADDHEVVRLGLRTWLESHPGFEVIAEAGNGAQAIELTQALLPDIIIMDITMPDVSGIEATRRITCQTDAVKVIALSIHSDKRFVARMFAVGARGYLLKDTAFREVIEAINAVLSGQMYISPGIAGDDVRAYVHRIQSEEYPDPLRLSDLEREILKLISLGKTTKEISEACCLSVKAIEKHRHLLMEKLDLHSIAELTKYAVSEGLASLE